MDKSCDNCRFNLRNVPLSCDPNSDRRRYCISHDFASHRFNHRTLEAELATTMQLLNRYAQIDMHKIVTNARLMIELHADIVVYLQSQNRGDNVDKG